MQLTNLRTEYLPDPLAVPAGAPRFSWIIEGADATDVLQQASQVIVSSAAGETVWDSGWVDGDEPVQEYAGPELAATTAYRWSVSVRTTQGEIPAETAAFETGLDEAGWQGSEWITLRRTQYQHDDHRPAPCLRTRVQVREGLQRARWFVTAGGLFHLIVNNTQVPVGALAPGWTDYETRVPYHTVALDDVLVPGENVIGARLGDGWWCGGVGPFHKRNHWGKHPVLRAVLRLEYQDGTVETVPTDTRWQGRFGEVQSADMVQGSVIDYRLAFTDWAADGVDAAADGPGAWQPVTVEAGPTGRIVPAKAPAPQYLSPVDQVTLTDHGDGSVTIDFGQNMAGVVTGTLHGPVGTLVRLRHAETLGPDGRIYTDNLRGARATDSLILSGGEDSVLPPFTYHGFRYLEVTGSVDVAQLRRWQVVPISSVLAIGATFSCSDPRLTQLASNIAWTMRSNFVDVMTDCPSRDERMGWTGDAQIFTKTATYFADVAALYNKWLDDVEDATSPDGAMSDVAPYRPLDWGRQGSSAYAEAGIIVPWELYTAYGDRRVLAEAVRRGTAWIDYVRQRAPELVWRENRNTDYGDWLSTVDTPKDLTSTAYFGRAAQLLAEYGKALGDQALTETYSAVHADIRTAFEAEYVRDGALQVHTQTAYTVALAFDLLSPDNRERAIADLIAQIESDGHVTCGFLSVSHLLPLLASIGRADVAMRVLLHGDYPGWLYPISQGATTIWERWDGYRPETGFQDPLMNSFNHFAMGSVGEFLFSGVGGVRPLTPGYGEIAIDPVLGNGLTAADVTIPTIRGTVAARWEQQADGYRIDVDLPANTRGRIAGQWFGSGSHSVTVPLG